MQQTLTVTIERIAHDGAGEAIEGGTPVRVHGMLPGEKGILSIKKRHGLLAGELKELISASPSRKTPEELHYLACSPWQVMEYPLQVELKQEMIASLFAYYKDAPNVGFTTASEFYGYRTKIEFSFCDRDGDAEIPLSLAFHERGGGARRLALSEGCLLASERMNRAALAIVSILRNEGYAARDLKTLVIRESKSDGKLLALLYAKTETIPQFPVDDIPDLSGFIVYHSTEKSPASVPTKLLWSLGDDHLTEVLKGSNGRNVSIRYSSDSFFQNNIPMFTEAMQMIASAIPDRSRVLDCYAGAGTIGLLIAENARSVRGVEVIQGAVDAAMMNAEVNGIGNYRAVCCAAEGVTSDEFRDVDVVVVDPPRVGLHPKLLSAIIECPPKLLVYLSCNPETQARDYSLLHDLYQIVRVHGFDFYPQTPHVESLLVLSRRN